MNIMPWVGYYWKHGAQINALFTKTSDEGQSSLLLDIAAAAVPVIKKHWPELNANSLLDDALSTLRETIAPSPASIPSPDRNNAS